MPLRTDTRIEILGIRHHGPGSARAVARALEELRPDAVVIEGPPELDALVPLAASPELVPPVAALVYAADEPRRASFYPMAAFSPEWVALRWGLTHGAEVRFADLPAATALSPQSDGDAPSEQAAGNVDAIGLLAAAAGYEEPERWWEDAVEHRGAAADPLAPFAAVMAAMVAVREDAPEDAGNLRREAAMRRVIRHILKGRPACVAVVCGAFHAPALRPQAFPTIATDRARLAGLRRRKVAATWAPWTARRLTYASGYGAGVRSPGWYAHAFATDPDRVVEGWMVAVARALRVAGRDAPAALVIDATALARTLATLRGRPAAGLRECTDAVRATLTGGSDVPLELVHGEVVVGHAIGAVPPDTPTVPLAADLRAQQRRARLKPAAEPRTITVDLRTPAGLAKSTLLHRLRLLDVGWGSPADVGGTTGTFKEAWQLRWEPELEVAVIEASVWGTTVEAAADARTAEAARTAEDLAGLTSVLRRALPAALPGATAALVAQIERRSAHGQDALTLMRAAGPLAEACRYGTVRRLDTSAMSRVLRAVVLRAAAGLEPAVRGLDDDAAERLCAALEATQRAVALISAMSLEGVTERDEPGGDRERSHAPADLALRWHDALDRVGALAARQPDVVHGLLAGRVHRLQLDLGRVSQSDAHDRLSRRLSIAADARGGAAYLEGFLDADATLLLLDAGLLATIDRWVARAGPEVFDDLLPLLRRTFARYAPPQRRALGERLARLRQTSTGSAGPRSEAAAEMVEEALLQPAVDVVRRMLGRGAQP